VGSSTRPSPELTATVDGPQQVRPHSGERPSPLRQRVGLGWLDSQRYRIIDELGEGGMGVVYEAFDRERGHAVALKMLQHFEADALYRFKGEFRALADVRHKNLVRLYELVVRDRDHACFAMELVRGVDFIRHVRADGETAECTSPESIERLRRALRQLVDGVQAMHTHGRIHRDLKPSNVLVDRDGRVVILDFGISTELSAAADRHRTDVADILGTPGYMAPEQAKNKPLGPASDWYSVGVILYEALVGRLPFDGDLLEVLRAKTERDAPPPSQSRSGIPPDLESLCCALLDRVPEQRPTGPEILQQLGVTESPSASILPAPVGTPLVGRDAQLRTLRDAFEASLAGHSVTVMIRGASGMGKSAVAQRFVDGLADSGEAAVLCGRAYERETVPYKAFDGVIDSLSHHLARIDDQLDLVELPGGIAALARIFPVLSRSRRFRELRKDVATDPHIVRRRAFAALRELLRSLALLRPLVVYIDDVQWGDADSASLLLELVRPPDAPPLLWVLTYRDNEAKESAFVQATRARWFAEAKLVDVVVDPLGYKDASSLALELLGRSEPSVRRVATAVAREAHGSPLLIEELARANRTALGRASGETLRVLTMGQLVSDRLERLPPDARRIVEIVAVAARRLPVAEVGDALGISDGIEPMIEAARAGRLLHVAVRDGREVVEISHDRLRETLVARLDEETLRQCHASLAGVLERSPGADAEAVAMHLLGAGERDRAATFADKAAEEASAKLAFDQAARLLRMTIAIRPSDHPDATRLQTRLGEVLEWAGCGADAARAYMEAAETAPPNVRVELQRAAAEQLLNSGRVEEGVAVLHRVLPAVGLKGPGSPAAALFWLIVYRFWGLVLGAWAKQRDAAAVGPADRVRIDALYAVAQGFSLVDVILGASMQARHLVAALRRGDRLQILRAISLETSHMAGESGHEGRRERALTHVGTEIVAQIDADMVRSGVAGVSVAALHAAAFFQSNRGVARFLRGRWKEARLALDTAYANTRNHAGWQVNANLFSAYALVMLGDLRELAIRSERLLSDAERRGDLFTAVNLRTAVVPLLALAADDPQSARRSLRGAIEQWSQRGFHVQHMQAMVYDAWVDLYQGAGAEAFERTECDWAVLKKSLLLNGQFVRGFAGSTRAYCAVAAAHATPVRRGALLQVAYRIARSLERERMPWISSHAALIQAGAANVEGDRTRTLAALRTAIDLGDAVDMPMHSAAARYRLGALLDSSVEGQELTQSAEEAFAARGVRNIPRFAGIWLPGRWER
jgi:serine/threonine protein kinase/tetratricopeptide (TPR) repeat protein